MDEQEFKYRTKEELEQALLARREIDSATGCWVWTGNWNERGYGRIVITKTQRQKQKQLYRTVHVVAAHIWLGLDLQNRVTMFKRTCECRACFNPEHLMMFANRSEYLKWLAKNKRKGDLERTTLDGHMCIELAMEIRDGLLRGERRRDIMARLGVSQGEVQGVAGKTCWKEVWKRGLENKYKKMLRRVGNGDLCLDDAVDIRNALMKVKHGQTPDFVKIAQDLKLTIRNVRGVAAKTAWREVWKKDFDNKYRETLMNLGLSVTMEQAIDIRDAISYGDESKNQIAARVGVTRQQVQAVSMQIIWGHLRWDKIDELLAANVE